MIPLANWYLSQNLRFCKKIGSGAYGLVYLVQDVYTGKKYALKAISKLTNNKNYSSSSTAANGVNNNKPSIELEKKLAQLFTAHSGRLSNLKELNLATIRQVGHNYHYLKEISIHLKVNAHPNVVTIHKVFNFHDYLFVLMDYYPNGDLFSTIVDKKYFVSDPKLIKKFFLQLISVVKYCHDNKVYHCDIKPENILVNEDYSKIALTDFGLAVQSEYISDSLCCGSSYYMAPERLLHSSDNNNNNKKQQQPQYENPNNNNNNNVHTYYPTSAGDIWSLGIILINLTCIRNPWMKASVNDETFEVYLNKQEILYKILPISKELLFILTRYFLVKNPYMRGTSNLEIIKKLIINCKSFTKTGPLSQCEIYDEAENIEHIFDNNNILTFASGEEECAVTGSSSSSPLSSGYSSPSSSAYKRSYEEEEEDGQANNKSFANRHKRLSISSGNSSSSLSSLSSLSSTEEISTMISSADSNDSCISSCSPITITTKPVHHTSQKKLVQNNSSRKIKFVKNSNEVNYVNVNWSRCSTPGAGNATGSAPASAVPAQIPVLPHNAKNVMSINNLIDFEFTFDASKQYSTSSLFGPRA